MKKYKKVFLLVTLFLTVIGLNLNYNKEKSYEYKNNNFLAHEETSTECGNVLPTDDNCTKKGTKTTTDWEKESEEEVDSCESKETENEKITCETKKKFIKKEYTGQWTSSGAEYTNWSCEDPTYPGSCVASSTDTEEITCSKYMTKKSCTRTATPSWSSPSCTRVSSCTSKNTSTERVTCEQSDETVYLDPICDTGTVGSGSNKSKYMCYNGDYVVGSSRCTVGTMTSDGCKTTRTVTLQCVSTKTGTTYGEWDCTTTYPASCTGATGTTSKVECSGPNYKMTRCTRSLISSGNYVSWTLVKEETVDSCETKSETLAKTECQEKNVFVKTVYKKGTVEVCEQCKITIPDTEKPVLIVESKEKQQDGSYIILIKVTDNEGVVSYQYGKQNSPTTEWISIKNGSKEVPIEIKNIKDPGTYYVFAKDETGNIGKASFTIVKEEDTEKPVVEIVSKKCENGNCVINAKLTDNVGVKGFYYSKEKDVANNWINIQEIVKEKIVEIKNVDETKKEGTYYVFAIDEAGNVGQAEYTITSKDLVKENLLDLSLSLKQEDKIIKNKIKITNNSTFSYNACNMIVEIPIDANTTLNKDSVKVLNSNNEKAKIDIKEDKILITLTSILKVNDSFEITFDTTLKNISVKKVALEPTVTFYETKDSTCNNDTESDKVISDKKEINIEIVKDVPDTGKTTTLFVTLGLSSTVIGAGLIYSILKKSKYLVK